MQTNAEVVQAGEARSDGRWGVSGATKPHNEGADSFAYAFGAAGRVPRRRGAQIRRRQLSHNEAGGRGVLARRFWRQGNRAVGGVQVRGSKNSLKFLEIP